MTSEASARDVFDGARYVAFSGDGEIVCVWHGSHTVNVYGVHTAPVAAPASSFGVIDAITVGDFETGEITLPDAREGIEILSSSQSGLGERAAWSDDAVEPSSQRTHRGAGA
jgi:hypothetical protein